MSPLQSLVDPMPGFAAHAKWPPGRKIVKWTKEERRELTRPVSKAAADCSLRRLAAKRVWKQADRDRAKALGLPYDLYCAMKRNGEISPGNK